jgi:hypothetical protein
MIGKLFEIEAAMPNPDGLQGEEKLASLEYWQGLIALVEDSHLDIHNNRTERALRGMVLGRKNHCGSRSERGTEVAAIFYSLIETAKLCGVDPSLYIMRAAEAAIDRPGSVLLPGVDYALVCPGSQSAIDKALDCTGSPTDCPCWSAGQIHPMIGFGWGDNPPTDVD